MRNLLKVSVPVLAMMLTVACASSKSAETAEEAPVEAMAAAEPAAVTKAEIGKTAPAFELKDTDGNVVSLAQFQGQKVVLEWFNPDCPYVKYTHGEDGPLKTMPAKYIADGYAWLAINSGGEGKQGFGAGTNKKAKAGYGMEYPVLLDPTGSVGKMYGARTTPHVYMIDEAGTLVYRGALDNAPLGELKGDSPVNYLDNAAAELAAGGAVSKPSTKSYGCGVKYAG